jgi:hypothetical protein
LWKVDAAELGRLVRRKGEGLLGQGMGQRYWLSSLNVKRSQLQGHFKVANFAVNGPDLAGFPLWIIVDHLLGPSLGHHPLNTNRQRLQRPLHNIPSRLGPQVDVDHRPAHARPNVIRLPDQRAAAVLLPRPAKLVAVKA